MTKAEYLAIRDENVRQRMQIMRVLDVAGLNGVALLDDYDVSARERERAISDLTHSDRMEIHREWRQQVDALLAKPVPPSTEEGA